MDEIVQAVEAANDIYKVKDIYLASYLSYKNYKVVQVVRNGFQSEFWFADVESDVIKNYYNRESESVRVKELFDSFKALRSYSTHISKVE